MAKIHLVDDQPEIEILLRQLIAPHELTLSQTAGEAIRFASQTSSDLIVLDICLPDGDGLHLLPQLRALPGYLGLPILLLSGKNTVSDRVLGLSIGADDYIAKPFDPLELKARIDAHLRRRWPWGHHALQCGNVRVDLDRMRAFATSAAGSEVDLDLTPIEFRIFSHLLQNEGRVFSRDQLITVAWSHGVHVLDRTIDRHISYLKAKLGRDSIRIETVRGEGYRLVRHSECQKEAA